MAFEFVIDALPTEILLTQWRRRGSNSEWRYSSLIRHLNSMEFVTQMVHRPISNFKMRLLDMGQFGVAEINYLFRLQSFERFRDVPYPLQINVGCLHWFYNHWFVIIEKFETGTFKTESFLGTHDATKLPTEGLIKNISWNIIYRFSFGMYPVSLKCAALHDYIIWVGIDLKTGNRAVYKMQFEVTDAGFVVLRPIAEFAIACSTENFSQLKLPLVEIFYPNLGRADRVEVVYACRSTVFSTDLFQRPESTRKILEAGPTQEQDITWFAVDHQNLYYMTRNESAFLNIFSFKQGTVQRYSGYTSQGHTCQREAFLEYDGHRNSQVGFWILANKSSYSLPVPFRHCIFPRIDKPKTTIHAISRSSVRLIVSLTWDNCNECRGLSRMKTMILLRYAWMSPDPDDRLPSDGNEHCEQEYEGNKDQECETQRFLIL